MDIVIYGAVGIALIALVASWFSFRRASRTRQWRQMCERLEAEKQAADNPPVQERRPAADPA